MFLKNKTYLFFLLTLLVSCMGLASAKDKGKDFIVTIDAGHGGHDVGATDNGVMEKNINLQVAKFLQQLINKKMKNTQVVMTRDVDKYLTLQERANVANSAKSDLFISIHTNSVDKKNKNRNTIAGSSVYALGLHKDDNNMQVARRENSVIELESNFEQKYSGFDPMKDESYIIFEMAQKKNLSQSIKFAEDVQKELVAAGRNDRGVHQAGFWVLWATAMPSVLIELDFICNPESAAYISSEDGAKELAQAIFNALQKYEEAWRKKNNYTNNFSSPLSESPEILAQEISVAPSSDNETTELVNPKKRSHKKVSNKTVNSSNNAKNPHKRRSQEGRANAAKEIYEEENNTEEEILIVKNYNDEIEEPTNNQDTEVIKKEDSKLNNKKSHKSKRANLKTIYKIQVLSSPDVLKENNPCFCGLKPISRIKVDNLYKYYYGESDNKEEIEDLLRAVRKKIPDAFITTATK